MSKFWSRIWCSRSPSLLRYESYGSVGVSGCFQRCLCWYVFGDLVDFGGSGAASILFSISFELFDFFHFVIAPKFVNLSTFLFSLKFYNF